MPPKYIRGLETELKILNQFAVNREIYQYDLAEKVGVSYRTALRVLHSLEEDKYLRITRKEESQKQGKDKNVWQATIRGLLSLLTLDEKAWNKLDSVAEAHPDKLLIFEKWFFFEKEGLTEAITHSLKRTIQTLVRAQLSLMTYYPGRMRWTDENLKKLVDSMSLGCYALRDLKRFKDDKLFHSEVLKILKASKKDEELHSFIRSELAFFIKIAKDNITWLERATDRFESL